MYRGRSFQREQVYVCGGYLDGDIYPVFQQPGRRRKKCKPTKEIQKKLNKRNAGKKLTRIVRLNFTESDLAVHLTYATAPETEKDALRLVQNYLLGLKRRYKKLGEELKYILVTEKGGRGGRFHHHLIISGGLDRDEIEKLWKHGYANSRRLQFQDGAAGLAKYITKGSVGFKSWSGSRNLEKPAAAVSDGKLTARDVRELADLAERGLAYDWFEKRYPQFELTECEVNRNGVNGGVYIHFEMRMRC